MTEHVGAFGESVTLENSVPNTKKPRLVDLQMTDQQQDSHHQQQKPVFEQQSPHNESGNVDCLNNSTDDTSAENTVAVTEAAEERDALSDDPMVIPSSSQNIKANTDGSSMLGLEHSFGRDHRKLQILIGVTGSVAAIKLPDLISEIYRQSPDNRVLIRIVATESSAHFFDSSTFEFPVYHDKHEWDLWKNRGDPILHIELRRWADLLVIAPLDANTLAKIANGICDNLLTCVVRAWDPNKPLFFCPAMNTYMLEHPLTFKHLDVLKNLLNFKEIPCVEKELMCGDRGYGAMAPVQMIASVVAGEVKKRFAVISRS